MNGNCLNVLGNIFQRRILGPSLYRTVVNDATTNKTRAPRNSKTKATAAEATAPRDVREYFEPTDGNVLKLFPPAILKKCSQNTERFYVANQQTAQQIADVVTQDLPPDRLLVEVNPGPGLLTEQLLKREVKNLRLYETDAVFEDRLQSLNLPNDALRIGDFNGLWRLSYLDGLDNGRRVVNLMNGLPTRRWQDEVGFRLFSVIGSVKYLRYLINSITSQNEFFMVGRYEMVLAMSPLLYSYIASTKNAGYKLYRGTTIVFQLYFEHELLGKVPRRHFLPWYYSTSTKKYRTLHQKLIQDGTEEWYLVKIVPRKNLFEYLLSDNLSLFASFVTQHFISRRNRIIPSLEHWIPHCGARLLLNSNYTRNSPEKASKDPLPSQLVKSLPLSSHEYVDNMTIYTEFGELTPSEVLTLFNEFINWPDFHQCPFMQAVESNKLKQRHFRSLDDEDTVEEPTDVPLLDGMKTKAKRPKTA